MATSVVDELVAWNNTTATEVKSVSGTGAVKLTSGVYSLGQFAAMPWVSGRFYDCASAMPMGTWGSTAVVALRLYATPIYIPNDLTISQIGVNCTAAIASALGRLALYNMGTDGKPGSLVVQGGSTIDLGTTGEKTVTVSQAVIGGKWYYLGFAADAAISIHGGSGTMSPLGYSSHSATVRDGYYYRSIGSLVLPDPWGTPTGANVGMYRISVSVA